MEQIIIYGKKSCPYTDRARAALPGHVYHDVKADRDRLQEMLAHSGNRRQMPVIVVDGRVSVGYGGS